MKKNLNKSYTNASFSGKTLVAELNSLKITSPTSSDHSLEGNLVHNLNLDPGSKNTHKNRENPARVQNKPSNRASSKTVFTPNNQENLAQRSFSRRFSYQSARTSSQETKTPDLPIPPSKQRLFSQENGNSSLIAVGDVSNITDDTIVSEPHHSLDNCDDDLNQYSRLPGTFSHQPHSPISIITSQTELWELIDNDRKNSEASPVSSKLNSYSSLELSRKNSYSLAGHSLAKEYLYDNALSKPFPSSDAQLVTPKGETVDITLGPSNHHVIPTSISISSDNKGSDAEAILKDETFVSETLRDPKEKHSLNQISNPRYFDKSYLTSPTEHSDEYILAKLSSAKKKDLPVATNDTPLSSTPCNVSIQTNSKPDTPISANLKPGGAQTGIGYIPSSKSTSSIKKSVSGKNMTLDSQHNEKTARNPNKRESVYSKNTPAFGASIPVDPELNILNDSFVHNEPQSLIEESIAEIHQFRKVTKAAPVVKSHKDLKVTPRPSITHTSNKTSSSIRKNSAPSKKPTTDPTKTREPTTQAPSKSPSINKNPLARDVSFSPSPSRTRSTLALVNSKASNPSTRPGTTSTAASSKARQSVLINSHIANASSKLNHQAKESDTDGKLKKMVATIKKLQCDNFRLESVYNKIKSDAEAVKIQAEAKIEDFKVRIEILASNLEKERKRFESELNDQYNLMSSKNKIIQELREQVKLKEQNHKIEIKEVTESHDSLLIRIQRSHDTLLNKSEKVDSESKKLKKHINELKSELEDRNRSYNELNNEFMVVSESNAKLKELISNLQNQIALESVDQSPKSPLGPDPVHPSNISEPSPRADSSALQKPEAGNQSELIRLFNYTTYLLFAIYQLNDQAIKLDDFSSRLGSLFGLDTITSGTQVSDILTILREDYCNLDRMSDQSSTALILSLNTITCEILESLSHKPPNTKNEIFSECASRTSSLIQGQQRPGEREALVETPAKQSASESVAGGHITSIGRAGLDLNQESHFKERCYRRYSVNNSSNIGNKTSLVANSFPDLSMVTDSVSTPNSQNLAVGDLNFAKPVLNLRNYANTNIPSPISPNNRFSLYTPGDLQFQPSFNQSATGKEQEISPSFGSGKIPSKFTIVDNRTERYESQHSVQFNSFNKASPNTEPTSFHGVDSGFSQKNEAYTANYRQANNNEVYEHHDDLPDFEDTSLPIKSLLIHLKPKDTDSSETLDKKLKRLTIEKSKIQSELSRIPQNPNHRARTREAELIELMYTINGLISGVRLRFRHFIKN